MDMPPKIHTAAFIYFLTLLQLSYAILKYQNKIAFGLEDVAIACMAPFSFETDNGPVNYAIAFNNGSIQLRNTEDPRVVYNLQANYSCQSLQWNKLGIILVSKNEMKIYDSKSLKIILSITFPHQIIQATTPNKYYQHSSQIISAISSIDEIIVYQGTLVKYRFQLTIQFQIMSIDLKAKYLTYYDQTNRVVFDLQMGQNYSSYAYDVPSTLVPTKDEKNSYLTFTIDQKKKNRIKMLEFYGFRTIIQLGRDQDFIATTENPNVIILYQIESSVLTLALVDLDAYGDCFRQLYNIKVQNFGYSITGINFNGNNLLLWSSDALIIYKSGFYWNIQLTVTICCSFIVFLSVVGMFFIYKRISKKAKAQLNVDEEKGLGVQSIQNKNQLREKDDESEERMRTKYRPPQI